MATTSSVETLPAMSSFHAMGEPKDSMAGIGSAASHNDMSARAAPPPNPTFSFPARDDSPTAPTPTPRRTSSRRPMSAVEPSTQSYQLTADPGDQPPGRVSLPAFSFNPGATLAPNLDNSTLHAPVSPQSPRSMPSGDKPVRHGHRRGGSEFVGGRIRDGNSIAVMNGSPTKSESGFISPGLAPPRRGHRRGFSSALSTNDLSLLPPPPHNFSFGGSSAPNSPTRFEEIPPMPPLPPEFQTKPTGPTPTIAPGDTVEPTCHEKVDKPTEPETAPALVEAADDLQPKPASRTRVGFSDTLEYIPRPLSLVSTDTSSTVTARPSHGKSSSVNSLTFAPSPSGRESPAAKSRSPSRDDSRPSTAGAILERTPTLQGDEFVASQRRRNSIPTLLDIAESSNPDSADPSPTKASRRWTFFGLDPFSTHHSPSKGRPHSASSGDTATRVISGASSSDHGSDSPGDTTDPAKQDKKKNKRRKRVKGWADSILPRKSKSSSKRSKYAVRPPTPPPASAIPPEEEDDDAMEPEPVAQVPPTVTITESPTPPRTNNKRSDDLASPMIDLDAALGPFNTPLPSNPEWEAAQRAAGNNNNRRRLHSAQGMRGFSGPGMHYHRRTESAPDLPPFDPGASTIQRFASSSTMADVFEEDEELEEDSQGSKLADSSPTNRDDGFDDGPTPPAMESNEPRKELCRDGDANSLGISNKEQVHASLHVQRSKTSLHDSVIMEESPAIRFRTKNLFSGSDASGSPPMPQGKCLGNREQPPSELGLGPPPLSTPNMPSSPHSMSYASSPRSPMSADTQRLSTAPSSVHEDNSFHSLLMGEPGPEVRLSVDYDIPSLTSSTTTMTRESNVPPQTRMSQPTLREPRPLSVSSAAYGRRRSSLVSLSRLISSSHGERSKLSSEVTWDTETENKKARDSKAKRLGRLVQFWKPKGEPTS